MFEKEVNDVVSQMTQDNNGNWVIPEGVEASEEVRFAANLEKRRRDTQSALAKKDATLRQVTAERDQFAQGWESDFAKSLDPERQAELEELKATDPDAWRAKLNEYEQQQLQAFSSKREEISTAAKKETEQQVREREFSEWQQEHPDLELTDDILANDVPPRIARELEQGKVSFRQFLDNCATYLTKAKVLAPKVDPAKSYGNLGAAAGGSAPAGDAIAAAARNEYSSEIF